MPEILVPVGHKIYIDAEFEIDLNLLFEQVWNEDSALLKQLNKRQQIFNYHQVSGYKTKPDIAADGSFERIRTFRNSRKMDIKGLDGELMQTKNHILKTYQPNQMIVNDVIIFSKGVIASKRFHHVQSWTFIRTGENSCRIHMSATIKWEKWHILKKIISANTIFGFKNLSATFYASMNELNIKRISRTV